MSPAKTIVNIITAVVGVGELARYELTLVVGETICRETWWVSEWDADPPSGLREVKRWVNTELLNRLRLLRARSVEVGYRNGSDREAPFPDDLHQTFKEIIWDFFATNLLAGNL